MSNWSKVKLSKLCYRIGDGLHGTPNYIEDGEVFFINGNNLKNGAVLLDSDTKRVSETELISNYIELNENSLLMSINGTLGNMAFYRNEKVMLGKSAAYLNFKYDINRFYYYYFQLPGIQKYFYDVATGSTIKNLSLKSLQDFEVPLPDQTTYKKIAKVLSSLDEKIELNNKINAELEAMAKTLYDYWFVQFDFPDANGKPYKSSGGKMVWNETLKREIPEGWEVKRLEDIENKIVTGKTPPTQVEENFGGDIPFITIDDIRKQLYIFSSERTLTRKGANSQVSKYLYPGDICISCIGTIGVIGIVAVECQTNQQINSIASIQHYNRYFLLNALKKYFEFNGSFAKQGAVLVNMNKGEFAAIKILDSPKKLKMLYLQNVSPLYSKIENSLKQNQELTQLRDWLLPMLMNGQVTVGEADEKMGMVAEGGVEYKKV